MAVKPSSTSTTAETAPPLRDPDTLVHRAWWRFLHSLCFIWFMICYRFQGHGSANIPDHGPVLYVCNHQSFLDPIIVGLAAHRRPFFALARLSLFGHPILGWLIRSLNAIPVERGTSDMAAMRLCLTILDAQHALMVYPEGTRTPDGTTKAFSSGTMLLIRRGKPTVVPVAIEGAYAVWPRNRKAPAATGRISVKFGKPIASEALLAMGSEAALTHLREEVETMRLSLAELRSQDAGVSTPPTTPWQPGEPVTI